MVNVPGQGLERDREWSFHRCELRGQMKQRELHKLHKHKSNKSTDMVFQLTFDDKDAINLEKLTA